jgi:hypothetical protein
MADEAAQDSWFFKIRETMRNHKAEIAILVFVIGIFLTALPLAYFTPFSATPGLGALATAAGNFNLLFAIVGPIIFIVGAFMFGSYVIARRKFEHLMLTKSKAEFLRNIPELEDILWDLTPNDIVRYEQRKSELRIRR